MRDPLALISTTWVSSQQRRPAIRLVARFFKVPVFYIQVPVCVVRVRVCVDPPPVFNTL